MEDNTLIIPSIIGDSPVTTVGQCEGTLPANTKVIVSEGITSIVGNAFVGQKGLAEIELPASLEVIDMFAFQSCTNLTSITFVENSNLKEIKGYALQHTGITDVELPTGLEGIGNFVFYNTKIESITIPASVTTIGAGALSGAKVKEIILESNEYFIMENYCLIEKNTGRIIKGLEGIENLNYNYSVSVKILDEYSLMDISTLINVIIPEGVHVIRAYALHSCNNITSISLPSTLLEIQGNAIGSSKLTEIVIPSSVTKISQGAFIYSALENIEIEGGNNEYFKIEGNCLIDIKNKVLIDNLSNAIIPSDGSVNIRGTGAFMNTDLTSIIIPDTITGIQNFVFQHSDLTNIEITSSVKFIGYNAFASCKYLTNVTLGSTTGWQVKINGTWQDIPSTYDLSDGSVVAELLTKTYVGYYWQNISE